MKKFDSPLFENGKSKQQFHKQKLDIFVKPPKNFYQFKTPRQWLTPQSYSRLKINTFLRDQYQCQVPECTYKINGEKKSKESHLRIDFIQKYDFEKRQRTLLAYRTVCEMCYLSKNYNIFKASKQEGKAIQHLMNVNKWSAEQVKNRVQEQTKKLYSQVKRCQELFVEGEWQKWVQDFGILNKYDPRNPSLTNEIFPKEPQSVESYQNLTQKNKISKMKLIKKQEKPLKSSLITSYFKPNSKRSSSQNEE